MINRIKQFYAARPWTARLLTAFIIFSLLLIGIRLALSPTIIYGANSWLKKQGIDSAIEAVNINILDGTVSLVNARGSKNRQPIFNIGLVEIHWQWRPLSKKTIVVTRVALDSLSVNIEQYTDAIIVSGISIPLGSSADKPAKESDAADTDEDIKAWAASIGEVVLTKLDVCYLQHTSPLDQSGDNTKFIDYCINLDEMRWAGTISYATDSNLRASETIPVSSTGDFSLNGLSITDNRLGKTLLTSQSNTLSNVVISGLSRLHIDQLEMNALSLLQRDDDRHIDSVRFSQLVVNDITLSDLNSLAINSVSVSKPGVYLVRQNQTDWEYQQWIPQSPGGDKPADNNLQQGGESAFNFSLNDLNIADSDLCYLDNGTAVYYCLTFEDLGWNGSVKYGIQPSAANSEDLQVKGDLKLTRPVIHNQTLNRDLLNFASLALAGVDAAGTDKVSLNRLDLKKLNALQRGESHDDNTVSFDELAIDDVRYTASGIAVNTIKLTGLANNVSINKDGKWEHDKWLPNKGNSETEKTEEAKADAAGDAKGATAGITGGEKPFNIALHKLDISSDGNMRFTDNSTQPAMEVGLQSLAFDISKLDSTKPDTNSPFELQAKTSRHSTIDLKGTIRPFAEKVSLAAKGELKGLDLRVASPAVKKAVGHIIQSGQMDADLDLKAVEGQLDSKISLSLYQFQIKSVSKEDAKKLDEKFGMPLNQALVLLRDKDDSIHLDIPVTGDINNPNFDPMDAIIKATSKATTVTLITFYTPYGLIYHGGSMALNLATALNFDPIQFPPGSAELLQSGKEQLDGLSKLLTEKPKVHLTLCGVTNQQDVVALYPPEAKKDSQGGKVENSNPPLSSEQLEKLNQLASERQNNSKNYLVSQHGIDHSRLILCEPEHKTEADAVAGVEINI